MAACLIISFARSKHLNNIITSAKEHNERVYIYQNLSVMEYTHGCELVSAVIKKHLDDKTYYFRPEKHLCSEQSIVYAITEFFKKEEIGTILEDDCIPSDNYWKLRDYFFRHQPKHLPFVLNGYNPVPKQQHLCRISQVAYPHVWGWTSNRVVWGQFLKNYEIGKIMLPDNFLLFRNFKFKVYWIIIFWMVKNKKIMTWDYKFLFFILRERIPVYGASENFITNDGADEYATFLKNNISDNIQANTDNVKFFMDKKFDHARTVEISRRHYRITWLRICRMLASAVYFRFWKLCKDS